MFRKYQKCAVPGCLQRSDRYDLTRNVKFFCFPRNNERCLEWLQAIKNRQFQNTALSTIRGCYSVCEHHFETCMFQTAQREKLNRNARPTLLLPRNGNGNGNENKQAVEAPLLAPSVPDQPQGIKQ
jgi:hypothetical protein